MLVPSLQIKVVHLLHRLSIGLVQIPPLLQTSCQDCFCAMRHTNSCDEDVLPTQICAAPQHYFFVNRFYHLVNFSYWRAGKPSK